MDKEIVFFSNEPRRLFSPWLIALALFVGALLTTIIPPIKSPDEADHIRRAYTLSHGQLLLSTKECESEEWGCRNGRSMSGGDVDTGLETYLRLRDDFNNHDAWRVNQADEQTAEAVMWSGNREFFASPGTGYYFPLIYLPQASALALGEFLGLSVENSYYLSRAFVFLAAALTIALAYWIWPIPPIVVALICLPMALFQMVSATIDAWAHALALLAIACFMRIYISHRYGGKSLFYLMIFSLFMVSASRAHLSSMVILPFFLAFHKQKREFWISSLLLSLAVVLWVVFSASVTFDFRLDRGISTGKVALYYLKNPLELFSVFWRSFHEQGWNAVDINGFIGRFYKVFLPGYAYSLFLALLSTVILFSLASWQTFSSTVAARACLVFSGLSSAFLALLSMLLTWTHHPAEVIHGIQGRYFWVSAVLLALAFVDWRKLSGWRARLTSCLLFLVLSSSLVLSVDRMVSGFYVQNKAFERIEGKLVPSRKVTSVTPLRLDLPAGFSEGELNRLGLLFGTYQKQISGSFSLDAVMEGGQKHRLVFDPALLKDNKYFYLDLPKGRYSELVLQVLEGEGGVSVWEFWRERPSGSDRASSVSACLSWGVEGDLRLTEGCPAAN